MYKYIFVLVEYYNSFNISNNPIKLFKIFSISQIIINKLVLKFVFLIINVFT